MKSLTIIILTVALAQLSSSEKVDYCSPAYMCGSRHIMACNHTGQFDAERCPKDAKMLPMTEELKELFLHEHNKYRNEIAQGLIFEPAAAMATLEWDDELAYFAELNVKQCGIIYEDTKCITSARFNAIDQNIGRVFYLKSKFNPDTIYDDLRADIKRNWFDQHMDCTQELIDSYHPPGPVLILHFGKMMLDRNNRLGCAVSIYENVHGIDVLYTCDYARRLYCYKPIFRSGSRAGSNCSTGMNPHYPFLCSTKEYFNVNDYSV